MCIVLFVYVCYCVIDYVYFVRCKREDLEVLTSPFVSDNIDISFYSYFIGTI